MVDNYKHKHKRWRKVFTSLLVLLLVMICLFLLWAADYYHAGNSAAEAMISDDLASVTAVSNGYLFDGPGDEALLIFYPGAKVEETAYAPLMRELAEEGIDVQLVRMPLHLAFLGMNDAEEIIRSSEYEHYYIGGHSLGGAMAADYANRHSEELDGVILLAAYPTSQLPDPLIEILIYGSEDEVLNMDKVQEGEAFAPETYIRHIVTGGNHAQFGDYGAQKGDGSAVIPAEEQWDETVQVILDEIEKQP